ncbi:MAG: 16S rRNA (cytosine(1402)-N(4))-methyltransferase RsmH [Clostridia bacterium]|nr:16S rRNA (cytosine(1402)-N(4))-methyltransferase RsmH [Clostridia bacterium]
MTFKHIPVLLHQTVKGLECGPGDTIVDGTTGGGGHSSEIIKNILPGGRLVCIDRDIEAIQAAKKRLETYSGNIVYANGNFKDIKNILKSQDIEGINGAILDLGVSSYQIDNIDRGFTYKSEAPLDMRMDRSHPVKASDVVNQYSKQRLADIIKRYGEERWASRIAEFIVEHRQQKRIETTSELVDIIKRAIPVRARITGGHPAKRTFQAIRIEVNQELKILEQAIKDIVDVLKPGGRLCIITFHSLEDRIVKNTFKMLQNPCTCPPEFPICVCGKQPVVKVITSKPIIPSEHEIDNNPRAKSSKLRICEKI